MTCKRAQMRRRSAGRRQMHGRRAAQGGGGGRRERGRRPACARRRRPLAPARRVVERGQRQARRRAPELGVRVARQQVVLGRGVVRAAAGAGGRRPRAAAGRRRRRQHGGAEGGHAVELAVGRVLWQTLRLRRWDARARRRTVVQPQRAERLERNVDVAALERGLHGLDVGPVPRRHEVAGRHKARAGVVGQTQAGSPAQVQPRARPLEIRAHLGDQAGAEIRPEIEAVEAVEAVELVVELVVGVVDRVRVVELVVRVGAGLRRVEVDVDKAEVSVERARKRPRRLELGLRLRLVLVDAERAGLDRALGREPQRFGVPVKVRRPGRPGEELVEKLVLVGLVEVEDAHGAADRSAFGCRPRLRAVEQARSGPGSGRGELEARRAAARDGG
ncbi:uncharacterized protein V1510DRAFT_127753 [Dipodascopsis tothii]|uniref:uncharacterized protein n=1 Tax=Dipodascopsis tothii TaxID=44089 RepID=UPI0034CEB066